LEELVIVIMIFLTLYAAWLTKLVTETTSPVWALMKTSTQDPLDDVGERNGTILLIKYVFERGKIGGVFPFMSNLGFGNGSSDVGF
jgi:hypothetical protein